MFILNGLTEAIKLTFSFRQGDPISMILYLIYIEPLLVMLGKNLQGLQFPNFREIDDDYCDDIEILIEKDEDLILADEIFRKFESFAGAMVNRSSKSKILGLGGFLDRQDWPLPWLKVEKSLRIFGIHIYPTYHQSLESNWAELLKKFRESCTLGISDHWILSNKGLMYSRSLQLANFGIYAKCFHSHQFMLGRLNILCGDLCGLVSWRNLLLMKQRTLGRRVGLTLFVSYPRLMHFSFVKLAECWLNQI